MLSSDALGEATARLAGVAHRTPVLTSRLLDEQLGAQVFMKAEHLQATGSFKIRGAYNAMAALDEQVRARGVAAFSSGNHAQAVARAAQLFDISAVIVMPEDAPAAKLSATTGYGAEVVTHDRVAGDREKIARAIAAERGLTVIPPFNHPDVIAGQSTVGQELFDEVADLDTLVVCVGGGGLIAGCALAAHHIAPRCRVVGVEPAAGNDVQLSLREGRIVEIDVPHTIADGQQTTAPGEHTFEVIRRHVDEIVTVSDDEILDAMDHLFRYQRQVVEPSGATALAAVLAGRIDVTGQRVGVTLSGG
ncbi:MAG: pyridoxal-phosphate dependent enzyme, partial [Actinomycetota bacterium]|nr:pyridoxal-phosphate dependent enzyme [Actinomycetota bacterium]